MFSLLQNHVLIVRWVLFQAVPSLFFIYLSQFYKLRKIANNSVLIAPKSRTKRTLGFVSRGRFLVLHQFIAVLIIQSFNRRRNRSRRATTESSVGLDESTSEQASVVFSLANEWHNKRNGVSYVSTECVPTRSGQRGFPVQSASLRYSQQKCLLLQTAFALLHCYRAEIFAISSNLDKISHRSFAKISAW